MREIQHGPISQDVTTVFLAKEVHGLSVRLTIEVGFQGLDATTPKPLLAIGHIFR